MYFLLPAIASCYQDLITTLKSKIARLHELTKSSTYYEFFNLRENCTDSEISKAFRKLRKSLPPPNLTKDVFDELVMNGYSLLGNYRKAYDSFLSDSKYIYITDPKNFKNYFIIFVIAVVCILVFIDFVVYAIKYLKYSENGEQYKRMKKTDSSVDSKAKKNILKMPPMMVSHRLINSIRRLFKRRA